MYRAAGAIFLLISAIGLGMILRNVKKQRIQALKTAVAIVRHARRKIDLFDTPAADLFTDFSTEVDANLLESLQQKPLREAIQPLLVHIGAEGNCFSSFADSLGDGYRADTLKLCEYTEASLQNILDQEESEYPAKAKLYMAMPLLFAISVIVLLV